MNLRRQSVSRGNQGTLEATLPKRNILIRTGHLFGRAGRGIVNGLKKKNTYVEIISALLIILFIYTGLNKMMDIDKFKFEMGRSPFIQNMSGFIAYTLPTGEMLLALLLIIKRTRLLGLYFSFALMALFTGYIWLMLNYAYDLPCSCGGIISKMSWHQHLVFNAVFTGLSMVAIILQSKINFTYPMKKGHLT
jgi:hypothetical protein